MKTAVPFIIKLYAVKASCDDKMPVALSSKKIIAAFLLLERLFVRKVKRAVKRQIACSAIIKSCWCRIKKLILIYH